MLRIWGKYNLEGGFEVSSKHDLMTLIITLALILAGVVLDVTGHLDGGLSNLFIGIIPGIFGYWFGRGGNVSAQDSVKAGVDSAGGTTGNSK